MIYIYYRIGGNFLLKKKINDMCLFIFGSNWRKFCKNLEVKIRVFVCIEVISYRLLIVFCGMLNYFLELWVVYRLIGV